MNINETEEYLIKIGIPNRLYSVNSLGGGDCTVIAHNYEPNEGWTVFYSEEDACDFFIQKVIKNTKFHFDSFERQRINNYKP